MSKNTWWLLELEFGDVDSLYIPSDPNIVIGKGNKDVVAH